MIQKFSQNLLIKKFDKKIAEIIQTDVPILKEINQFVILSGGKRIRPLFHYFLAELNHYHGSLRIDTGAIAEIIHAASLLHDDVIDNATIRRGKHTIGKLYGNKVAILSGDYLLTSAIDYLSKMGNISILNLFNSTIKEITKSELMQMQWEKNPAISMKIYEQIIYGKTASLFGAIAESAGILASLKKNEIINMRNFGVRIGRLFQLKDDYIDYFLPAVETGKLQMKDFLNGLVTHPMILLIQDLSAKEKKNVTAVFHQEVRNDTDITMINNLLEKYKIQNKIQSLMKHESSLLLKYLSTYPDSEIKNIIMKQIEKLGIETVS